MVDISTQLLDIKFNSCIMNASGVHCTTRQDLNDLLNSNSGVIVSKSSTINIRNGNEEPRLYYNELGSINSMGIPNLGYKFYSDYGTKISKPFIQSIYPFDLSELDTMLNNIDSKIIEVNLSCPNLKDKTSPNYDFSAFEKYIETIKDNKKSKIIGLKLAPVYDLGHYDVISNLLLKSGSIDFITCCNSVTNGLLINSETEETRIFPRDGLGGIGGVYCKPVCLSNVYNFHRRLGDSVKIIGCGGIASGNDVFEYLLCGAFSVQVGTHLLRNGLTSFVDLENELGVIMERKGYGKLSDFIGNIKVIEKS